MINIIAAIGNNNELGKDGKLIWPIKNDLKFFKETTWGHDIIMGRKTFDSLPGLLKGRRHIVLTRGIIDNPEVKVYHDIDSIIMDYKDKDAFVIGGESVYNYFIDIADNMYLTLIDASCDSADAFFPQFNEEDYEQTILGEGFDEKQELKYKHVLYKRR